MLHRAPSWRGALKLALVLLAVAVLVVGCAYVFQRKLVYLPDTSPVPPAAHVLEGAEDVRLTTSDGLELGAWYVPPRGQPNGVTVLVANGNGGNRAGRAPLASALAQAGFATLLFDYRGYGGNPGSPTEDGLALDVRAARAHLVDERGVHPERLLYFGESLGTGVVAELATEHPPAGLLLRSPFTDLATAGQRAYPFLPVRWLLKDRFPVVEHVAQADVPTTVVWGSADLIVPPSHSERVADAARGPVERVVFDGVGHNDRAMFSSPQLVEAVEALARRAVRGE